MVDRYPFMDIRFLKKPAWFYLLSRAGKKSYAVLQKAHVGGEKLPTRLFCRSVKFQALSVK
jgi:hypothetical protein